MSALEQAAMAWTDGQNAASVRGFWYTKGNQKRAPAMRTHPGAWPTLREQELTMPQYSVRAQFSRRKSLAPSIRTAILDRDCGVCQYCGEPAEVVDHIVPWSYGGTDHEDNLVASCRLCNAVAHDNVFDTFQDKKRFINERIDDYIARRARAIRRTLSVCGDCQQIFQPRLGGATALLCPDCNRRDLAGFENMRAGDDPPAPPKAWEHPPRKPIRERDLRICRHCGNGYDKRFTYHRGYCSTACKIAATGSNT